VSRPCHHERLAHLPGPSTARARTTNTARRCLGGSDSSAQSPFDEEDRFSCAVGNSKSQVSIFANPIRWQSQKIHTHCDVWIPYLPRHSQAVVAHNIFESTTTACRRSLRKQHRPQAVIPRQRLDVPTTLNWPRRRRRSLMMPSFGSTSSSWSTLPGILMQEACLVPHATTTIPESFDLDCMEERRKR
jgi:hypothetical protein